MIETLADFQSLPRSEQKGLLDRLSKLPELINEHIRWLQDQVVYGLSGALDMGQSRRTKCLHASSAGYYLEKCPRMAWYDLQGTPKDPPSVETQRIFHTGHAVHAQVQAYLLSWSKRCEDCEKATILTPPSTMLNLVTEVSFWDQGLLLSGHCDGVGYIQDEVQGLVKIGVEIKSMKQEIYRKAEKAQRAFSYHLPQACVYGYQLDLPITIFLYFNKNTSDMLAFPVAHDPKMWEQIENCLLEAAAWKTAPPRQVGFHCRDCDYNRHCKPGNQTRRGRR